MTRNAVCVCVCVCVCVRERESVCVGGWVLRPSSVHFFVTADVLR
jgi:hypothetical protein